MAALIAQAATDARLAKPGHRELKLDFYDQAKPISSNEEKVNVLSKRS